MVLVLVLLAYNWDSSKVLGHVLGQVLLCHTNQNTEKSKEIRLCQIIGKNEKRTGTMKTIYTQLIKHFIGS